MTEQKPQERTEKGRAIQAQTEAMSDSDLWQRLQYVRDQISILSLERDVLEAVRAQRAYEDDPE